MVVNNCLDPSGRKVTGGEEEEERERRRKNAVNNGHYVPPAMLRAAHTPCLDPNL